MFSRFITTYVLLTAAVLGVPRASVAQLPVGALDANAGFPAYAYGSSVDVSGNVAVVGAPSENVAANYRQGAAYVFSKVAGTWGVAQRLLAADGRPEESFGAAVAVSGTTIAVAAPGAFLGTTATRFGAVYVFVHDGSSWVQQAKLVASNASASTAPAYFGTRIALDGDTVIVGAHEFSPAGMARSGAAYAFERTGGTWVERPLLVPGLIASDSLGSSVDVAGDTACIGAWGSDTFRGAVYVFTRGLSGWSAPERLVAPDGVSRDYLSRCTLDGNSLLLGTDTYIGAGAAYVFARSGPAWTFQSKLLPGDSNLNSQFGSAVRLSGDTAFVAARAGSGALYTFRRSGASWQQVNVIRGVESPDPAQLRNFATAIAVDGTTLIAGTPCAFLSNCRGAAFVYDVPARPGAPQAFQAVVSGSTVSMSWVAPSSGGAPQGYTVLARAASGGPVIATVPVGTATTFSVVAPDGRFVVSAVATNTAGAGPESAAVTITVPALVDAPGPPTALAALVSGSTVTFQWTSPSSGGAPSGYVLLAGATPAFAAPIATLPLPVGVPTATVGGVPAGRYYVRIVARNAGGSSAPSNEVAIVVGNIQPPGVPVLQPPQLTGATVRLDWTPSAGGAPSSYTLVAALAPGGAPVAMVSLTGTTAVFQNVPSGTYYLRLSAANGVGTSGFSNQVTVVVP